MRRLASVVALSLVALSALAAAEALSSTSASPVAPSATSFTLSLVADRSSAEPNETITYTLYLNVTGGGNLQLSRVNFSVEPDLEVQAVNATDPPDCAPTFSNATFAEWQCSFLRVGRSYRWTIPVSVARNATIDRYRTATAAALEVGGGPTTPQQSQLSIWIIPMILRVTIEADPLGAVHQGDPIHFFINVTNVNATTNLSQLAKVTGYDVVLTIGVSPGLDIRAAPTRYGPRSLSPQSSMNAELTAFVEAGAPGSRVWINATVVYRDVDNHTAGPKLVEFFVDVLATNPLPLSLATVLAVIAFALLSIFGAAMVVPALGEREVNIDEVFLMHRSGILIRHLSHGPGLRKDDDLVASMFVAIQEFVRDSFHTKATLDEIAFAGRKAAVLRGRHIVLAALISKGSPRYVFPQMKAVERALEKAHGPALEEWDGRLSSLGQAGPILEAFLRGGYRRFRRWRRR